MTGLPVTAIISVSDKLFQSIQFACSNRTSPWWIILLPYLRLNTNTNKSSYIICLWIHDKHIFLIGGMYPLCHVYTIQGQSNWNNFSLYSSSMISRYWHLVLFCSKIATNQSQHNINTWPWRQYYHTIH